MTDARPDFAMARLIMARGRLDGDGQSAAGGFCRDCRHDVADTAGHCPNCRSPRLLRHRSLSKLAIAHVDCDAFYATVEKRDNPSLVDQPIIVGGRQRGVVLTACYVARTYGIRSAMPIFEARRLCPDAVYVPPDMEKYARVGREVRALMCDLTPLVEPVSIDEAFIDLSGTDRLHGVPPAKTLAAFAERVEREIGITVSIGLSCNKFLAKIASDLDKPRGFAVLAGEEAAAFLAPRPVTQIFGVGKAAEKRFAKDGIATVGDLQRTGERELMRRYGSEGVRLYRLAHGHDERPVRAEREAKTVSAETTFDVDLSVFRPLELRLWRLTERVSARLKNNDLAGSTVTLKLKTADFRIRTRAHTFDRPTQLAGRIFAAGRDLLERETDGTKFRLIGIGVSSLCDANKADTADLLDHRTAEAEHAIDRLRARFGDEAVFRGLALEGGDD
jgi:DNA polymerase-4